MSNCTLNYIERKFRESNPEKADYFNNMTVALWKKLDQSLLFTAITKKNELTKLYSNAPKTLKRKKQEEFIDQINNELNAPIISINDKNLVKINLTPLFGDDINAHVNTIRNITIDKYDITPYLEKGYDVKGSILKMIDDTLLSNRISYIQTKDEFGNLVPGSYIINPKSEKVTRAKNPNAAAKEIANYLEDKIESEFPGVSVITNLDSYPVRFKISPWKVLLQDYTKIYSADANTIERGQQDKTVRKKYFSTGDVTTDKEILNKIAQSNHPLNKLAEYLIPFSKGIKITLLPVDYINSNDIKAFGVYTTYGLGSEDFIEIAEFSKFKGLGSEPTIIHEILHGLTVNWLNNVNQSDPLYKEFNRLYNEAVLKLGINNNYGLTNIREFAVALFTDAEFINKIKQLPSDNPTKYSNLFEEILNHILKLFKLTDTKNTLYTDAFAVVTNIINSQKKLENDIISNFNEFEELQDDVDNYYIEDYLTYTNETFDIVEENKSVIKSTIFELNPTITEEKIKDIYDNYESLMNKKREGKAISFDIFKSLIKQYQVFNYKNTYIFGNYDVNTGTFITRLNSSPSSKELLAEAIPNIVNNGIDFISFVPKDYADKLVRSGYISSKNSFKYNFKGELMDKFAVASNENIFKKIFNKNFNQVTSEEIENFNESIQLQYNPVEINSNLISQASNDASKILETYLKQFGITIKDINLIKDTFNIDELGFVDLLSKIIYVKDKKDLPTFAGEAIAYMMQYNSLVKEIINNLIQTNAILIPKNLYTLNEKGDKVYNYNKLDKTEFFKYIGNLISEDLNNKLEGNYDQSLVAKIKQLIKTFFDYITKSDIALINKNIGIITNNILQQNKKLITSSLYKPGAYGKPVKQVSIEDALKKDTFGKDIIYKLSNEGFILTGSTALSEQGTILRPDENPLHDIDWVSPFNRNETINKFLKIYPNAIKVRDIYGEDQVTDSYLIAPEGYKISNYKINEFNGKIIIDSYNIVDKNNNIVGTYKLQKQLNSNQSEEIVTGIEGKVIDFFSYNNFNDKNKNKPFIYKSLSGNIIQLSNWKDIFKAKLEFARYKDIWDYNRFIANENIDIPVNINPNLIPDNIEEQFNEFESLRNKEAETTEEFDKQILYSLILPNVSKEKFFNIFSQNNPEEFDNYRQKEVKRIINTFAEKFGITIEQINEYQDRYVLANDKTLTYNGVANLANKTIKYLEGDDAALTEEVAHFMIAMLPKTSPEYVNLKNYISRTPEYQIYYEGYLKVYNGDVDKTEEEIMGKVVANNLLGVTENVPLSLKSIITAIVNYINNFFNPEYRKDFQISVDNINHLFFTENFDNNFSEANISFDQLYSLKFTNSNDEKVFNLSTDQILQNILTNLRNQRQRFIENKQTDLIKSIDNLIDIITEKDSTITNADKIINYVKMSLLEIQKVEQSLSDFEKSGILQDLESKNFNNLTKEQQEVQTQEDRANHLQYVAAAITTLQNLNSFINLIEWNFKGFNNTYQSLSDYNKIIETLPDSNENKIFSEALKLTKASYRDAKLGTMKGVYLDLSQKLLKVSFETLNTQDQKNFLELTQTNLTPNIKNQEDINNDISTLATIKDLITGNFNISTVKENIMPLTFQKDVYLRAVDNANASLRQFSLMASAKDGHEYNLIQEKLNQLNVFDESWVSAKDEKGKFTFKLLQKYNFKLFKKSLAQKIVTENLASIINQNVVLNEVENKDSKILKSIIDKKYNSPNAVKDAISQLYVNKKISKSLYLFLTNYINGYETLYTLQLSEQSNALSNNNQNILQSFKNQYILQLENNLNNLNFNKKSLPYFNNKFAFTPNTINQSQLTSVVNNVINNRREALIKKFVVVPPTINGNENPVYINQLAYVEGLLNYFKNNIGYSEDIEGYVKTDYINYLMLGDEYFFNLSDKNSISGINFIDKDYVNLEKLSQSNNPKEKEIATLKLKAIEKIKEDNIKHNMPSNYLGGVLKNNSAAYLSNSKQYREFYNRIFRIAFPLALTIASPVNPLSSVILYLTYRGGLDTLFYKPIYFLRNDPTEANLFKKAYNAWKLSLSEAVGKDLREKNIRNNEQLEKEVAKGFKKIIFNLVESIKNKLNKNRINDNVLLLGEYKIPKPFEYNKQDRLLLSTDFLSNQKSITQARYNYETNIRWESWIRMASDYNDSRTGVTNSNIINTIKDRHWFFKFYKPSTSMSTLRYTLGVISSKLLKGNIQSGILNLLVGQWGSFLHTNPSTFAKSVINMFNHNARMVYMGTNLNNVVNEFIGMFGNPNNPNVRKAFFDALKNMFLGRDTNVVKYNNNLIKHISKNLRKNRGTGFIDVDEAESILTREFNLTNNQLINNLGEKFIEENTIFQYLNTNPIIDENGNPIKNLKKYLKVENGIIVLDKTKLPKNLYLKNSTNLAYKNYYNIDINSNISISKITPKDLGLNPLTNVELNEFLNFTMLTDISNLMEKSQGVYNIFNKAYWRNTKIGLILFQFKDYILPSLTSTMGSRKIKNNFTSYETGVLNSLAKAFDRMAISGYRLIDKNFKFTEDVDQNFLILNNVSKTQFIKELNFFRNKIITFFHRADDQKIDKKLKELASNNEKFRKDTNRKTSSEILLNLPVSWYLTNIKDKPIEDINYKIEGEFNLNTNNPNYTKQLNYIKNLIDKKFKTKENITQDNLDMLTKFDIDQNYLNIVQAYLKVKLSLTGDIEAINKLINFSILGVGVVMFLAVLKALDWPEEQLDEEGNKILNWKDWLIAVTESGLSSLLLNYLPYDIDDAYGAKYDQFILELYKLSPLLNQTKDLIQPITTIGYEEKMLKNITKEDVKFLLTVREMNEGKLPLLKPKLKLNEDLDEYELIYGSTLLFNELKKIPINQEILNTFSFLSEDPKKLEERRTKSFMSLLAKKTIENRAYKFGDRNPSQDPEKVEEQKELLQEYQEESKALLKAYKEMVKKMEEQNK